MLNFIIDGYNVIHAMPALKKTFLHDAGTARELLIDSVARLTYSKKLRATIVFDGSPEHPHAHHSMRAPVHVIYSFPRSADEKIKQLIEESKKRSSIVVISSDRTIQNHAAASSCAYHTSRHFSNLLSEVTDVADDKSDITLTPSQVQEWLKIFGENS